MPKRATITKPPLNYQGETVGQRLARLRKERGFTQVELAERVGTRQALVTAYETDRRALSAEMAVRLAMALDVSTDDLLHPKTKKAATKKPSRKVLRRLEQIESLPIYQQRALLTTIDTFIAAAASK